MTDFNAPPFQHLDPSPLATSVAAWVLAFGVLRYRLLDLRPVARTHVVETMWDAVLVADAHGHVVDLNPAAFALLGGRARELVGRPVASLLSEFAEPMGFPDPGVYDVRWGASHHKRDMELAVTVGQNARLRVHPAASEPRALLNPPAASLENKQTIGPASACPQHATPTHADRPQTQPTRQAAPTRPRSPRHRPDPHPRHAYRRIRVNRHRRGD